MINKLDQKGEWCFPNESLKYPGRLTFDIKDDLRLVLPNVRIPYEGEESKIIHGTLEDGSKITLFFEIAFLNQNGTTILGDKFFIGAHYQNEQEILFSSIEVEFQGMSEWFSRTTFNTVNPTPNNMLKTFYEDFPTPFHISDQFSIHIKSNIGVKVIEELSEIKQKYYFCILSKKPCHFQDLVKLAIHYSRLFSIISRRLALPLKIVFREEINGGSIEYVYRYSNINMLYNQSRKTIPFIKFQNIKESFGNILKKWLQYEDRLNESLNLWISSNYNTSMPISTKFILMAQSIECLHSRIKKTTKKMSTKEYRKVKSDILNYIHDEHKELVADALAHANKATLHMRIQELIDCYATDDFISEIKDKEDFIKRVKVTRNYYTHYSIDKKTSHLIAKKMELFYLTRHVSNLIVLAVLSEIGIDKEELEKESHILY